MTILAGDVGGTNTRLGLFERDGRRPRPAVVRTFPTREFRDLPAIVSAFANDAPLNSVGAACFGVAGPVVANRAVLTNVEGYTSEGWKADAREVSETFGISKVAILNDLEAMAHAVPELDRSELHVLQPGQANPEGNIALIAAGTGLGESTLHRVGDRFVPIPSEGGHASFAPRSERDIALLRDLTKRFGRAEVEHVLSGSGLLNLHRVTHSGTCPAVADLNSPDAPAAITTAALDGTCNGCVDTLAMFVEAYGAEAGNLALRSMATAGVFVGGGIAPKILPALTDGLFLRAFVDKMPPFREMLAQVPVSVIVVDAGLVGASVYAAAMIKS